MRIRWATQVVGLCVATIATAALGQEPDAPSSSVEKLWSAEPVVAMEAERELLWGGPFALPALRKRLQEEADVPARVAALVAQLDHERFDARERASTELEGLGADAESALDAVLRSPSPEVAERARIALERIRSHPPSPRQGVVAAVRLLAILGAPGDEPLLRAFLDRGHPTLRACARAGLRRIGSTAAKDALSSWDELRLPDARWECAATWMRWEGLLVRDWERLLSDWPSEGVRLRVYQSLGSVESTEVIRVAVRACLREDSPKCTYALQSLLSSTSALF